MINSVRKIAIPMSTMFGGVCWTPIAFLRNDRMITVLAKEDTITKREGRSDMIVSISNISSVGT